LPVLALAFARLQGLIQMKLSNRGLVTDTYVASQLAPRIMVLRLRATWGGEVWLSERGHGLGKIPDTEARRAAAAAG
jgi:hypothetical protein